MPRNTHPAAYADIQPILDAALAAGGAAYKPRDKSGKPSHSAAIAWRARAYAFRNALRQQLDPILGPRTTPYDSMVLRIDPSDPTTVWINRPDPVGDLIGLDGKPLPISPAISRAQNEAEDPLLEAARVQAPNFEDI